MPISRYKCRKCGKEFAKIYFNLEDAPQKCPVCDAPSLEELGAAFHPDARQMERALCVSCDSCAEEGSCGIITQS